LGAPEVSVVVPAYDAAAHVEATIESVLQQSLADLELIVVDDGSRDDTAARVAAVRDPRLRLVSQPNRGVCAARNRGIAESSGPLVAFLDADDLWYRDKLAVQTRLLADRPTLAAVGARLHYIGKGDRILGVSGQAVGEDERRRVRRGEIVPFPLSSLVVRRRALDQAGAFDTSLDATPGQVEDLELLSRLAAVGELATAPAVLGAYRVHAGSVSARRYFVQMEMARFVQARVAAREVGGELRWEDYARRQRPTLRERQQDLAGYLYRTSGLAVADGRWPQAVAAGLAAGAVAPARSARRLLQQRVGRTGGPE